MQAAGRDYQPGDIVWTVDPWQGRLTPSQLLDLDRSIFTSEPKILLSTRTLISR